MNFGRPCDTWACGGQGHVEVPRCRGRPYSRRGGGRSCRSVAFTRRLAAFRSSESWPAPPPLHVFGGGLAAVPARAAAGKKPNSPSAIATAFRRIVIVFSVVSWTVGRGRLLVPLDSRRPLGVPGGRTAPGRPEWSESRTPATPTMSRIKPTMCTLTHETCTLTAHLMIAPTATRMRLAPIPTFLLCVRCRSSVEIVLCQWSSQRGPIGGFARRSRAVSVVVRGGVPAKREPDARHD